MNWLIVMNPDRPHMAMDILVPFLLGAMADVLKVAKFRNPDDSRLQKSPDHEFIVISHMKLLIMASDGFVK